MTINGKLLLCAGRPAQAWFKGGFVSIEAHDTYHITMRRRMLRDLKDLHPDAYGARRRLHGPRAHKGTVFMQAIKHYKTWMREECAWYGLFDLELPLLREHPMQVTVKEFVYTKDKNGKQTSYHPPFMTKRMFKIARAF